MGDLINYIKVIKELLAWTDKLERALEDSRSLMIDELVDPSPATKRAVISQTTIIAQVYEDRPTKYLSQAWEIVDDDPHV